MSEYLQWFSKDFGAKKRDALRKLLALSGRPNLPVDALKIKVRPYIAVGSRGFSKPRPLEQASLQTTLLR